MNPVFEEERIQKAIWTLGIPAMLGQLASLIYNIVDTYFVSLTRSPAMIAAVTLCTPILLIVVSVSSVFGMGGGSVIARLLGAKDTKSARACASFCNYTMLFSGVVVMLIGLLFIQPIAKLAGADEENLKYTCDYLRWIFLGAPFMILSTGILHIFRSTGLIRQATTGLIFGNCVNIVLDWVFIVLLHWGTAGAAAATSIGYLFSTVYFVVVILRQTGEQREIYSLSLKDYRPTRTMTRDVVKIGIPGALITIMLSAANIVLNNYISRYGSDAVASYGVAYKINMFPVMLSVGLSQGVAPLMGYCYGARQEERLNKTVLLSTLDGVLLGLAFVAFFLALSKPLASIFLHEETLIEQSALFIRILCLSGPLMGVINMITSYFQSLGMAKESLVITMLRNAVLFIPGVILLNRLAGLNGTIAAQPAVESVVAVVCLVMFFSTRRKLHEGEFAQTAAE